MPNNRVHSGNHQRMSAVKCRLAAFAINTAALALGMLMMLPVMGQVTHDLSSVEVDDLGTGQTDLSFTPPIFAGIELSEDFGNVRWWNEDAGTGEWVAIGDGSAGDTFDFGSGLAIALTIDDTDHFNTHTAIFTNIATGTFNLGASTISISGTATGSGGAGNLVGFHYRQTTAGSPFAGTINGGGTTITVNAEDSSAYGVWFRGPVLAGADITFGDINAFHRGSYDVGLVGAYAFRAVGLTASSANIGTRVTLGELKSESQTSFAIGTSIGATGIDVDSLLTITSIDASSISWSAGGLQVEGTLGGTVNVDTIMVAGRRGAYGIRVGSEATSADWTGTATLGDIDVTSSAGSSFGIHNTGNFSGSILGDTNITAKGNDLAVGFGVGGQVDGANIRLGNVIAAGATYDGVNDDAATLAVGFVADGITGGLININSITAQGTSNAVGISISNAAAAPADVTGGTITVANKIEATADGTAFGWFSGAVGSTAHLSLGTGGGIVVTSTNNAATGIFVAGDFLGILNTGTIEVNAENAGAETVAGIIIDGIFTTASGSNIGAINVSGETTDNVYGIAVTGADSEFTISNDITVLNSGNGLAQGIHLSADTGTTTIHVAADNLKIEAQNGGIVAAGSLDLNLDNHTLTLDSMRVDGGTTIRGGGNLMVGDSITVWNTTTTTVGSGSSLNTSGNVSVAGTLAGSGTVVAATGVHVGATGILSPGDSTGAIGTLLINGNLNMDTGSTLRVDIGANNASDLVSVSGTATIEGGVHLVVNLSSLVFSGSPYTLISADTLIYTDDTAIVMLNGEVIDNKNPRVILSHETKNVDGKELQLTLSSDSPNDYLTWTGVAGDHRWNLTSENWDHSTGLFIDGDDVTFDRTGTHEITIEGTGKTVADMTVTGDGDWTFIGDITGDGEATTLIGHSGALTKEGTGTLILDGTNEFKGSATVVGATVRAGTLQIGRGGTSGTMANNIVVAASANVTFDRSDGYTYTHVISGEGSVTKLGAGTLILTGNNTYTGGTTVRAGTLQIHNDGRISGGGGIMVEANAHVRFSYGIADTYGDVISGDGNVIHAGAGAGALTLSGNNTYTGTTTIDTSRSLVVTGTLGYDGVDDGDYAGNISNLGSLTFNQSVNQTLSGVISGGGSVTKTGTGTLILTGDNTYAGDTTVTAGILQIGNDGTTGSVTGNIANNANVTFDRSNEYIYSSVISGSGSVTQAGSGTLTLAGANTYTGDTNIGDGSSLVVTGTLGSGGNYAEAIVIGNAGSLTFNQSGTQTLSGIISGDGNVTKTGTGTLILTNVNDYTGGTTVNAGILQLNAGASIGVVTVEDGATLAGYGTVGAATFQSGAVVSPGSTGIGEMTFDGDVIFGGGSIFRINTGAANVSDKIIVSGTGTVSTSGSGIFDIVEWHEGVFTVLTADTALGTAFNGWEIWHNGTVVTNDGRYDGKTEVDGRNLILTLAIANLTLTWAGNDGDTWSNGEWLHNSVLYTFEEDDSAIFHDAIGHHVVVDNDVIAENMTIALGTWNFTGGVITLTGELNVANGATLGLEVNSGARLIANTVDFNASGILNITGYTPAVAYDPSTGYDPHTVTDYPMSSTTVLTSTAPMTSMPTYTVAGQPIANVDFISANARLAEDGKAIVVDTTLTWYSTESEQKAHGTFTIVGEHSFTLGAALTDNSASTNKALGWDGNSLTKEGEGTLILTGNNEYTGSTTINSGALVIEGTLGYDGNDNVYAGDITNNASLTFRQTANQTLSGIITGTGSLIKEGTGTLTLTGENTYTGITTVNGGELFIGTDTTSATARINGAVDVFGGTLGGYGTVGGDVEVEDGAWLIGNLTIDGTLMLNSGATLSPGNSTGTITVNRDVTFREGSRYVYEIDKDNNAHDLLVVTSGNTITIEENAELEIIFITGTGGKNERYQVIAAEPSQFVFSHAEEDLFVLFGDWTDMFNQRILDDGYYILWSVVTPEFVENISAYGTPNAIRVAAGMDELVELTLEEGKTVEELRLENALFDALAGMPGNDPQALANAFAMLHGEVFAINQEAAARLQRQFLQNVPSAEQRLRCLQSCVGDWNRWATFTGDWLGRKNLDRYSGYDLRTAGVAFGLDRQMTRTSMFGFALGYDKTNMDLRTLRSQDEMEAFRMALYGGWWSQNTYVDAYAGYTKNWHKTRRSIDIDPIEGVTPFKGVARSQYSDDMVSTGFEVGHHFAASKYGFITPSFGLHYIHLSAPGITETGAGDADLHIQSSRYSSLRMPAGLRWSQHYAGVKGLVWIPELRTYYVREIADDSASVRTSFHRVPNIHFIADSRPWGRDSLQVGTGLTARLSERLHVRLDYDREIFTRNLAIDHFAASLGYAW